MKKCRICKKSFEPQFNSMQRVCSITCGIDDAKAKQKKAYKAETKRMKAAAKSRGEWLREAQTIFNKYIRMRDAVEPCISCGRHHAGQYHAGHYKTVGAHPGLRFNEMNCWKQCSVCNNYYSGNIIEYRKNLLKKIGEDNLNWLEGNHEPQKYSIDEIKEIKEWFKYKLRQLELAQ